MFNLSFSVVDLHTRHDQWILGVKKIPPKTVQNALFSLNLLTPLLELCVCFSCSISLPKNKSCTIRFLIDLCRRELAARLHDDLPGLLCGRNHGGLVLAAGLGSHLACGLESAGLRCHRLAGDLLKLSLKLGNSAPKINKIEI